MRTENGERVILCFDRDRTVSVNPAPNRRAVPIGWVQYWAHETETPVWATGNQHLRSEASIPGIREAEFAWREYVTGKDYEYEESEFENYWKPCRRDGLRIIQDVYQAVFPDEDFRFVVVDDVDVSDLSEEGPWTHYFPWNFVEYVESGGFALDEPPEGSYTNDGVPFNSTGAHPDFDPDQGEALEEIRNELSQPTDVRRTDPTQG